MKKYLLFLLFIPAFCFSQQCFNLGNLPNIAADVNGELHICDVLGTPYIRSTLDMQSNNVNAAMKLRATSPYKLIVTFDNTDPNGVQYQPNMALYKTVMREKLTNFNGSLPSVIVENNEQNHGKYWTGSMTAYLDELRATIQVGAEFGIPVSDGGMTAQPLCIYIYNKILAERGVAAARAYSLATIPSGKRNSLGDVNASEVNSLDVRNIDTLIRGYRTIDSLSFVNFHWYENSLSSFSASGLKQTVDSLRSFTGHEVISNEVGTKIQDPALVTAFLNGLKNAGLRYAIWFNGDGSGGALALTDADGTLRLNGTAFKQFVATNICASTCNGRRLYPKPRSDRTIYITDATKPIQLIDGSYTIVNPGDTLVLKGDYLWIQIRNLKGTASCPIVIINEGYVTVGGYVSYTTVFQGKYFKVTGTGDSRYFRGIYLHGVNATTPGQFGINPGNSSDYTIENIEMDNMSAGIISNPTSGGAMRNVTYRYILGHNFSNPFSNPSGRSEFFYLGNTHAGGIDSAWNFEGLTLMYDTIITTTGDGFQIANAHDTKFQFNSAQDYARAQVYAQGAGLIIGGNSWGEYSDFEIKNGYGTAIQIFGDSNISVHDFNVTNVNNANQSTESTVYINAKGVTGSLPKLQLNMYNGVFNRDSAGRAIVFNQSTNAQQDTARFTNLCIYNSSWTTAQPYVFAYPKNKWSGCGTQQPTATLSSFIAVPDIVQGGSSITWYGTLSSPAVGKVTIPVASNSSYLQFPSSFTISDGNTQGSFIATTTLPSTTQTAIGTATLNGVSKKDTVTINPLPTVLSSFTLSTHTIVGGNILRVSAFLSAPSVGTTNISVQTSNSSAVPASTISITNGNTSGYVDITTGTVLNSIAVTLSGAYGGIALSDVVTVQPVPIPVQLQGIAASPNPIVGTNVLRISASLNKSDVSDIVIPYTTNDASVPSGSITITAGNTSGYVDVTTNEVFANTQVIITGTYTVSKKDTITVQTIPIVIPVQAESLTVSPSAVPAEINSALTVTLNKPSVGSSIINITSSSTNAVHDTSFTIGNGLSSGSIYVKTFQTGYVQYVTLSTSLGGATANTVLRVDLKYNSPVISNLPDDTSIVLPQNTIVLVPSISNYNVSITNAEWQQTSGNTLANIEGNSDGSVAISNLSEGDYSFKLVVTDSAGLSASDSVTVHVYQYPTANVDTSLKSITLPINSITLDGSNSSGASLTYHWTKLTTSLSGSITSPNSAVTTVTGLEAGVYQFQLTVTNSDGLTNSANVTLTVNPAPKTQGKCKLKIKGKALLKGLFNIKG